MSTQNETFNSGNTRTHFSFFKAAAALARKVFRNANGPVQPAEAAIPTEDIPDSLRPDEEAPPRFVYDPNTLPKRLVVSIGGKTKLASSTLISLQYRSKFRWILVGLLTIVTIFLTPQLLPKWIGFHWSTPSNLCQNLEQKLDRLRDKMETIANITRGTEFVRKAESAVKCMHQSAKSFWNGRGRILYARDCISSNAKADTKQVTECIPRTCRRECFTKFIIGLFCKTVCTPRVCKTITVTDPASERRIAELNAQRKFQEGQETGNDVQDQTQVVAETANKKGEQIINRLLIQIDIASNLYILYTMLAIIIGTPVVIYKREKGSRVLGATFGLRKSTFIIIVIVALTIYDSGVKVFRDTDFPRLFRNFQNDPCYLDPKFSQARLQVIKDTCGNVTERRTTLEGTFAEMTRVFYDASLCEVCATNSAPRTANNRLVSNIDNERKKYSESNLIDYKYPGSCNATELSHSTATAPDSGVSFARAFLGSGILAQILLKVILSSWLVHLIAYIEPLTMHRGIVEVFGIPEGRPIGLTKQETASVTRFARDKHLLPLILTSILMVGEVVIIIYSVVESFRARNILDDVEVVPRTVSVVRYSCNDVTGLLT